MTEMDDPADTTSTGPGASNATADGVASLITSTVDAVIAGRIEEAREYVLLVDRTALLGEKTRAHAATTAPVKELKPGSPSGQDGRSKGLARLGEAKRW